MADTIETTTPAAQPAVTESGPGPEGEATVPPAPAAPDADSDADTKAGTEAGTDASIRARTEEGTEAAARHPADYSGLSLPEGYRTDDPVFADAMKLFGTEKIAPEVAQKLIDFTIERDREIVKAASDSAAASWTRQTGDWRATSEKEFTADQLGDARSALAQVFDKETVTYLESMGFTNHPGLIRGMVKVSKAIKDDSFVAGNAGRGNGALDPRSFYPNSQHN